jgi:DNA-directed RNA polymerase subunit RPC12/RpoP
MNRMSSYQQPEGRWPDIACPECGFVPSKGMMWTCAPDGCGGTFDTFETRARCPHCDAQFAWTACPGCGKASAHRAWYRRAG